MKARRKIIHLTSILIAFGIMNAGFGFAEGNRVKALAKLSIEELISMKLTSVLKSPQSLLESPAAIYVVTGEDIRRSGATGIPDLLGTVPGVQVAEVDENVFAISIRGFNDIHANKLLVMVDGRSVYNHIFSGVIWSHLDLFMADIERIEVIRGPGSSVWGANAVNGVINIITKNAADTRGMLLEAGGGAPKTASGAARYGGRMGENVNYRIYAKSFRRRNKHLSIGGTEAETERASGMGGFRADWKTGASDTVHLQGEIVRYESETMDRIRPDTEVTREIDQRAGHLLGRWRRVFSGRSEMTWQAYYQYDERVDDYRYDVIDLDFQHDYRLNDRNRLVWGLGYRYISDELIQGLFGDFNYDPMERDQSLYSLFVQDTIRLIPDRLELIAGSRFEHNDYTGYEVQPGVRALWTPHRRHAFWGAVSRAVRTPSRIDSDAVSRGGGGGPPPGPGNPGGPPPTRIAGDEEFDAEELIAYEIGYRADPLDNLWFDIALFYNVYDRLATYREATPGLWGITNEMEGETYGVEVSFDYRPVEWWRLSGAWSFLEIDIRLKNDAAADLTRYVEESNPRHQLSLHSGFDLGPFVDIDIKLRHVESVGHMRPPGILRSIPNTTGDGTAFDLRLAWKPEDTVEFSVTGRNLGGGHEEFTRYRVEKSVLFNVRLEF